MENPTGTISKDTLTNLKCSICDNYLTVPPILITSLFGNQYKCGRCYFVETEVNVPAIMYETLASTMKFPCIHPSCEREIPWNTIKSHEETCVYQPMKCPCGETLEIHEAHQHFLENHPDIISEESVVVENPGFSQFHTRFIVKNDVPFLVYVLCERKADIKVGVYSLQDTIKKYEFRLEISTNSNMSKITIPNKKITKFNTREHCSDCLLRTCRVVYHKYQNGANNPISEMTSARVSTSSVFKVLNCDDFILLITVIERGNRALLEANFTKNEQIRKSWECQICQEYLAPPIYLCPTGHSLCGSCKTKMAVCPYCILEIGESRNFTLEEMAEHVQLACQYETMGCRFVGNVEKLARHERKCEKSKAEPLRKKSRLEMNELQREQQKLRISQNNTSDLSDDDFWKSTSENCPETRVEISRRSSKSKGNTDLKEDKPKRRLLLFNKDGRPLNVNQAKLSFTFSDEDPRRFVLDVAVYKFLDTNLIEVDVQPIFVKLTVKGKVFQMVLPEEIHAEKSKAQRSQTTGHLVLTMPRVNYKPTKHKAFLRTNEEEIVEKREERKREYLEVEEKEDMDFSKIVENSNKPKHVDSNPEIPPLEYG